MDLPPLPSLRPLDSISPSFYNSALVCKAKAAWQRFGNRDLMPVSTGAILGSCFHTIMEMGNRGRLGQGSAASEQAKTAFDEAARRLFSAAHPLVRLKFSSAEKIPFYFQRRARAVALAVQASAAISARGLAVPSQSGVTPQTSVRSASTIVEQRLQSQDGTIAGRLDLLDRDNAKVTDYKSEHAPKDAISGLTEPEIHQLRLYAYLARENGHTPTHAAIVRGDGSEAQIEVSADNANQEAQLAKTLREEFNQAVAAGHSFVDLAIPSSANCHGCPCIPFCEPFWNAALPDWEPACGTNAEGEIIECRDAHMPGTALKTISIDCRHGSAPRGTLTVEQIPLQWLCLGSTVPTVGSNIRIVLAARPAGDPPKMVLRVDRKKSTTIWNAPAHANLGFAPPKQG